MRRKKFLIALLFLGVNIALATQSYAVTYDEIVTNYLKFTDAQFDEYKKSILDEKVEWEGTVYNVTKNWLDEKFEVQVDMNQDDVVDLVFDVDKNTALRINKGSNVKFSGSITHVTNLFGSIAVTLEDVSIKE